MAHFLTVAGLALAVWTVLAFLLGMAHGRRLRSISRRYTKTPGGSR